MPKPLPPYLFLILMVSAFSGAADLRLSFVDHKGNAVEGMVVEWITGNPLLPAESSTAIVDQVDKEFVPEVSVLTTGTKVSFPNSDEIKHHVYSFSEAKVFELPLYGGEQADPIVFGQPGVVVLGCNIHDWMVGYVYVAESPHFSVSDSEGNLMMEGLPEGEQQFRVWHPRIRKNSTPLLYEFTPGAEPETVELKIKPKRNLSKTQKSGGRYR